MCYSFELTHSAKEVEARFKASLHDQDLYRPGIFNGYAYPATPVITNLHPEEISFYDWGLIPPWAHDEEIRKYTLNARIETIREKPAYKHSIGNRCLILADGFFEWQWLDPEGRQKQKYLLELPEHTLFAMGGLWSSWKDPRSEIVYNTYTLLTMEANELLSKIHNTKHRMPVLFSPENGKAWLTGETPHIENDLLQALAILKNTRFTDS